jgi:hypothetical protein
MPWTFAHPAAVLPLRRLCPSPLNFAALVVGSMTPDLGYYFGRFDLAPLAHSFAGSLLVCLPSGLALLGLLCLLRKPLWFLLPQPHRAALEPVAEAPLALRPGVLGGAAASVVIGAWTHNAWDSFTHRDGWVVARLALLQEPLFSWAGIGFPAYYLLQHLSTLVGAAVLILTYRVWLRHRPEVVSTPRTDRERCALLLAIAAAALVFAIPLAIVGAADHPTHFAWRYFVFRAAVYGTAAFIPLLILCSILYYLMYRDPKNRAK